MTSVYKDHTVYYCLIILLKQWWVINSQDRDNNDL